MDPFFVVKAFVVILADSFQRMFNCGQKLDIDEQCIPWKGRDALIPTNQRNGTSKYLL